MDAWLFTCCKRVTDQQYGKIHRVSRYLFSCHNDREWCLSASGKLLICINLARVRGETYHNILHSDLLIRTGSPQLQVSLLACYVSANSQECGTRSWLNKQELICRGTSYEKLMPAGCRVCLSCVCHCSRKESESSMNLIDRKIGSRRVDLSLGFPLTDSQGFSVLQDRRRLSNRRKASCGLDDLKVILTKMAGNQPA